MRRLLQSRSEEKKLLAIICNRREKRKGEGKERRKGRKRERRKERINESHIRGKKPGIKIQALINV